MLMMKASSSRNESLSVVPANGPPFISVPQTAKHDSVRATVAVSRVPAPQRGEHQWQDREKAHGVARRRLLEQAG